MPRRKTLREYPAAVQQQIAAALGQVPTPAVVCENGVRMYCFTIPGQPIGKPRQTQRDKWAQRPCVMAYRAWADRARSAAGTLPANPTAVSWAAFFEFPESYSAKNIATLAGKPHRQKPDRDNIDKAILDSLFAQDCTVADGTLSKRWDDGNGPRIEVSVTFGE